MMTTKPETRSLSLYGRVLAVGLTLVLTGPAQAQGADSADARSRPPHPPKMRVDRSTKPLNFAFISYANPQQVTRDIGPVVKYLEPYVGKPIRGFVTLDYGSAIEAMRSGKADLATIDPLAFMMAHEQIGARPLLLEIYSSGRPTYHSSIWVRRDSDIKAAADLKGRTIAFADQIDMSGHLLPRDIFVQQGLISGKRLSGEFFKQVYFAGGDEQAVRAVLNGFVDAAGISQYAYLLLRPEERAAVMTIANSIESPSHLIMARKGLSDQACQRLKQAMLALDLTRPQDKTILDKLYGIQGYAEAKLTDFAAVAEVASRYGFVKKPQLFSSGSRLGTSPSPPKMGSAEAKPAPAPAKTAVRAKPVNDVCPFSGDPVDSSVTLTHKGKIYGFCCKKCVPAFKQNPQSAIARLKKQS